MIKAVIFDIDGTLVDSNSLHIQAWRAAFRRYGKHLTFDAVHEQMGKGGDQLIPVFCSPEEVERFGHDLEKFRGDLFMRDYLPRVKPYAQVRELFERIKADGLQIALASSAKEKELEHHEKQLGIADLLETATSSDDVEHSKPCPDIFEAALAGLKGVAPHEAIVIGDTPYDAQAAGKAGMRTIGVLSGGFPAEVLRANGAIEIYRDIADLYASYDYSALARRAK